MLTLDQQTAMILEDAVDVVAYVEDTGRGSLILQADRTLRVLRELLAARYHERQMLAPWERDLYDVSWSGSDSYGTKYFVTDRATGLQLHGSFSWAVGFMARAVADPAGTAQNHSTFCRCGADAACTWSRINTDKTTRQLGRSDEYNRETGQYEIRRWGDDEDET